MAVWQFVFHLVPRGGILLFHREIPTILEDFASHATENDAPKNEDNYIDYWQGCLNPEDVGREFAAFLPVMEAWGEDSLMYGSEHGDRIEIWTDDIVVAVDMRNFNKEFISETLKIGVKLDCLAAVVPTGKVVSLRLPLLLAEIRESIAFKFCSDPVGTLKRYARSE